MNVALRLGLALSLVLASACGQVTRPDGGKGLLPVGASAPELTGITVDGKELKLSDVRGRPAVVYFYPMDGTPGCTAEACAFRDAFARYEAAHVTIFGVSRDSEVSHRRFRAEHKLQFPLVPDESGAIARAYGVGSALGMTARVSFLVGPDGRIAKVYPDVDPGVHANEVLTAATALAPSSPASPSPAPSAAAPSP